MHSRNVKKALTQETFGADVLELLSEQTKQALQVFVRAIIDQEVDELAGPRHLRGRGQAGVYRAGSDPGSVRVGGQRMVIRKPRLKKMGQEIPLKSYGALKDKNILQEKILSLMIAGVSTRDYDSLLEEIAGGLGLSKSSVSRAFIQGSKQALEKIRTRDLSKKTWCAIQIDAIYFAGRSVLVALGIDGIGQKMVLGILEGNTESSAICTDLLQNLIERGLRTDLPFLFVVDGGKGLRKSIRDVFGERCPVQRCLVHKARNIEEYIPERAHPEFRRRWKKLRSAEKISDAEQELGNLKNWLSRINEDAMRSLKEAESELLTAQRFGAGQFLKRAVTNTNAIESVFSRVRAISARVKNWRCSGDQIKRWTAVALLHTEKLTWRIQGYFECEAFLKNLHERALPQIQEAA